MEQVGQPLPKSDDSFLVLDSLNHNSSARCFLDEVRMFQTGDFGPVIEANSRYNQVFSRRPLLKQLEDPSRLDLKILQFSFYFHEGLSHNYQVSALQFWPQFRNQI